MLQAIIYFLLDNQVKFILMRLTLYFLFCIFVFFAFNHNMVGNDKILIQFFQMFQLLLKATKPNQSGQSQSFQPNKNVKIPKNRSFEPSNGWGTPPSKQVNNEVHEWDVQTPAFLQKELQMNNKIQQVQDCFENGHEFEESEKVSEVQSVNDLCEQQGHPMILSNIQQNYKQGVDKLGVLRIRNYISELRQVHLELMEYIQDEKILMGDFQDKFCLDIEDFFIEYARGVQENVGKGQMRQLREERKAMMQKMQNWQNQCSRLNIQLGEARRQLQMERRKTATSTNKVIGGVSQNVQCNKCKALHEKLVSLQVELRQSQKQIDESLIENEQLQERIFDMEQKIVGIDLQVEKRLKEQIKTLSDYYKQSANSKNGNLDAQNLKNQIAFWKQKCQKYQQNTANSNQFSQTKIKLQQFERELQSRQTILRQAQKRTEQLKQANYQREHQILEAQQNLTKKINDIRNKQLELSRWEADLVRQSNDTRAIFNAKLSPQDESSYRHNSIDELNHSGEMSLKSFGRAPPAKSPILQQTQFKVSPRMKTVQQEIEYQKSHQYVKDPYQNRFDQSKALRRAQTRKYIQNGQPTRGNDNPITASISKKMGLTGSNYRDNKQVSPYKTVYEHRNRIGQNLAMGHTGSHYRDVSKNSRSSAAKSIKGGYGIQTQPQNVRPKVDSYQLTGLGSKLQKLREEIKREIDSIK